MNDRVLLGRNRLKFKGNLHLHTTWSDGELTAGEVVERYKAKGYHFLCFSDHDIYTRTNAFDSDAFITIPGMERGGLNPQLETNDNPGFHFTVLDHPDKPAMERFSHLQSFEYPQTWEGDQSVTACIEQMEAHGNLVVLNHPEWHMTPFEVMEKHDFFAVEVYNHATEWSPASSYGAAYLDYGLQHGKRLFAIASDDAHGYGNANDCGDGNNRGNQDRNGSGAGMAEYAGGWIVVDSDRLSHSDIMNSLEAGRFYASSGPVIHDFRVENGMLKIQCSEVQCVMFKSWPVRSDFLVDRRGDKPITEASCRMDPAMVYIRVECIDRYGRVAWTNPVFIADLKLKL